MNVSMKFKHVLIARHAMQPVHVLCDQCEFRDFLFHLYQCVMAGIRSHPFDSFATPGVPVPDQFGVTRKSLKRCQFLRLVLSPQTGLCIAKGSESAFL